MRPMRTAAAALLGAAAMGLYAPVATAMDPPVGSVSPHAAEPGEEVEVKLENCTALGARADGGGAFGPFHLRKAGEGVFTGKTKVFHDAKPGAKYEIKFWCGQRREGEATLRIGGGPDHRPTHRSVYRTDEREKEPEESEQEPKERLDGYPRDRSEEPVREPLDEHPPEHSEEPAKDPRYDEDRPAEQGEDRTGRYPEHRPSHGTRGGEGGSAGGMGTTTAAAGAGPLAAAAASGVYAVRRRLRGHR